MAGLISNFLDLPSCFSVQTDRDRTGGDFYLSAAWLSPVVKDKPGVLTILAFFLLICIPLSLSFQRITERTQMENSWKVERFVVNGKYLIVDGAKLHEFKDSDVLEVELQARELLTRYDLSEFRRKVNQNFGRDLIIRVNITYIP